MYFSVEDKQFIQILNTGHSHWATISTVGTSNHSMVNVYDSKYVVASIHLHAQNACLLMTQHAQITFHKTCYNSCSIILISLQYSYL